MTAELQQGSWSYAFTLGERVKEGQGNGQFSRGSEANPQRWEGRVRVQTVAEEGDKFNTQKAVFVWSPRERQQSGEKEWVRIQGLGQVDLGPNLVLPHIFLWAGHLSSLTLCFTILKIAVTQMSAEVILFFDPVQGWLLVKVQFPLLSVRIKIGCD